MFECAVCGGPGSNCWMGFVVMEFCEDCSKNKPDECNAAFKKAHDELVAIEARQPEIKHTEIDVKTDYLQYVVQNQQEPELELLFKNIANQVYELKITRLNCNRNWRWLGTTKWDDREEGKQNFVAEAVPFCYDRLQVYNPGRATALDYFAAACCGVYEQAKLKNWQDWAY